MKIERLMKTLDRLNELGEADRGIERIAYTSEEYLAKQYLMREGTLLGLGTEIDAAGNVIVRLPGADNSLPPVIIGSHLDTIYQGGKYDGLLGVVAGFEIIRSIKEAGTQTQHPIELIGFTCEESSRFNFATLGSKVMMNKVNLATLETLKDRNGISLRDAVKEQGLELDQFPQADQSDRRVKAFYELHIEQGPKLIQENKQIGIVTGIAAPLRLAIHISGKSSHSGTTGMKNRRDALLAAAELALAVEEAGLFEDEHETVATVGVLDITPRAMNVVPGSASIKVDIRSIYADSRERVLERIKEKAEQIERKRATPISMEVIQNDDPVMMDEELAQAFAETCEEAGVSYMFMASGAGHDAMNTASSWPTTLVFVPSVDGLSHHPDEFTEEEDIEVGVALLEKEVLKQAVICG
ncbi:Zn-dependent hydrolase [Oceanobacillus alkalisoli]|uniref:Zn-dependent hydrolase n=1 Tax=Oceanobacillus alkalisoli TaxID=2925113 RepID=UPI001F11D4BF|nr:Zn-dependent hydrolase [Oceanobacillus alkalisoli]MCF3944181.1 Zn-dependent hydrolase [Oceanobacillus alkalisoli]